MNKSSATENDVEKSHKRSREVASDVTEDAAAQLARLKTVGLGIGGEIAGYVKKQPLAAVGIAAGAGFLLGSIFGSRLGRMALLAGAGYVAQNLIEGALGEGGVRKLLVDEVSKMAKADRSTS